MKTQPKTNGRIESGLGLNNCYQSLRSQIVTLKVGRGQHSKYLPFVFTEQGVAMLSSVLNNERAIEINIAIMRSFVSLRKFALTYEELTKRVTEIEQQFPDIYKALNHLMDSKQQNQMQQERKKIGYTK